MKSFFLTFLIAICLTLHAPSEAAGSVAGNEGETEAARILVMLHLPAPHFRPDNNYGGRYDSDAGRISRKRVAQDIAKTYGLKLLEDWPMPLLGVDCYVMTSDSKLLDAKTIQAIEQDARVEWVQRVNDYHGLSSTNSLYAVQPSGKFWHIADVHKFTTGRNVSVVVIDSGVDDAHPDLVGQVALKENFVDGMPYRSEEHGTAVASIIAARLGEGARLVGIAPEARLMALRGCWERHENDTRCDSLSLAKALQFAIAHQSRVINLSLAGPQDRLLQSLIELATKRGIAVVAAIDPKAADGGFPASVDGVVAVDVQGRDLILGPPNLNRKGIQFAALGMDVPASLPGGRWGLVSGASYAAAHVTGLIALMLQLRSDLKPDELRDALLPDHAVDQKSKQTPRVIDACASVSRVARSPTSCLCACQPEQASKVIGHP